MASRFTFNVAPESVRKKVLSNGMTIIAYATKRVPKVLVQIAYDIGSAVEQEGEKGLAHVVEHMIFKGTDILQEGAIDGIARKYGATFNAFTSTDETSYYFEVDANNWKPFIPLLADCMKNATFDAQHLASEVKAVIQELNMYRDNQASRMVEIALRSAFPGNHPYHHPIIGYKDDLALLTADKLKKFYQKYYHPERAVLFIAGDINLDDAITYAEGYFTDIPAGGSIQSVRYPEVTNDMTINCTRIYEDVQQQQVAFYWYIPGVTSGTDMIVNALKSVMGSGEGSRLYRRLVDQDQIADDIGVEGYQMMHGGLFLILVEIKKGQMDRVVNAITDEMQKLIKFGVTQLEQEKITAREASSFVHSLESLTGMVYEWIESYFVTRNEFALFDKMDRIYKMTGESLQAFAAQYLDPFIMSRVEVMPFIEEKRIFWHKNQEHMKAIEEKILQVHQRTTPLIEPELPAAYQHPEKFNFVFPRPSSRRVSDSGLEVIFLQDRSLPIVNISLQFRDYNYFGNSREGRLVSVMMGSLIEGSTQYSKKELVEFFEKYGVSYKMDSSGATLTTLSLDQNSIIDRFFHMILNPKYDEKDVRKVLDLFIATLERSKDQPNDVGMRIFKNILYKDTEYEWTADDMIAALRQITASEIKALHDKVIRPENMIMSIVGDIDEAEAQQLIEKHFASFTKGVYTPRVVSKGNFVPGTKIDHQMMRDQIFFLMGQPSEVTLLHPDYVPLRIVNLIMFYSLGSRLFQLREQSGLFYTASGAFAAGATREPGQDSVYAIVNPDKVDQAEAMIREMFKTVARDGVTQEEIAAAQQMMLKHCIDLIANGGLVASLFAGLSSLGLPEDYYEQMITRVNAITLEEVNAVIKKYVSTENMARVRVGRLST